MKINIVLPSYSLKNSIAGGTKVVYQYSNYLASKGNDIYIYYNLQHGKNEKRIPKKIMKFIKYFIFKLKGKKYPSWFKLNNKIKQKACEINNKTIKDADIVIATAANTFYPVKNLNVNKGKKIYFIQGFETWNLSERELFKTYNNSWLNIVVSKWLKEIVDKYNSKKSILITNGVNSNVFKINRPIENRKTHTIAYLYHLNPNKGCRYGFEILSKLKKKYSDLQVYMFGGISKPNDLPDYISYTQNASEIEVAEILNNSTIFMCTSLEEGFGLPGLEAMMCGCTLVSTKTQGVYEYANDTNSLLSNIKDVDGMYNNICYLFDNNNKRIRIAKLGNKYVKNKNIENAQIKFEKEIIKYLKNEGDK